MKFRIGEFYKRLSTDISNGYGRFEVSGFVEGLNGLGCVAVSLGVSRLFERTSADPIKESYQMLTGCIVS
jgi:hypothetical protein